jgi:hypothetical protein
VKRYGKYRRKVGKIWKKDKLNSEMIWKIWKKSKLNSEKIWKISEKGKTYFSSVFSKSYSDTKILSKYIPSLQKRL